MKQEIEFLRVDPAGNITAFVLTPVPHSEWVSVGRAIMEQADSTIEQVGFISFDEGGNPARMDMMGGEFCGNATRSFGLYSAMKRGAKRPTSQTVSVSGASEPMTVYVDPQRGEASVFLPPVHDVLTYTVDGISGKLVQMEGIHHFIVTVPESRGFVDQALEAMMRNDSSDAYGVLFLNEKTHVMIPYVYVTKADTLYREGSCGSGSFAVASAYAEDLNLLSHPVALKQPHGTIQLSAKKEGESIRCSIGGAVTISDPIHATLSVSGTH